MYFLRKALNAADRLQTQQGGYTISLRDDDFLDLRAFQELKAGGFHAAESGGHVTAARSLQEALDLWRDPPLADFPDSALGNGSVTALLEQRACVQEALIDSRLALGQHRDLIARLRELTSSDPLRERYWEQLMLALYRSGSQAAALDAYSRVRTILGEECGIDPGSGLKTLQQRILATDSSLNLPFPGGGRAWNLADVPAPAESGWLAANPSMPTVPQELPGTVSHFTGRHDELARLSMLLDSARSVQPGTVTISVISGTAGVGKTALAMRWAHQAAEHFPDGQLYVNLRGYDPGQPVTPADALAGFLGSLGLLGREIPAEADERAAWYRSLVARRRMLIVLDNAREVEQVRPLLPGTPTCMTVVTSRDALAGLVAREGAQRLDLDMMPAADAVGLLVALIGERAAANPDAAEALADQCCRLPLALRVAAELAAVRRSVPLAELASELNGHRRLDLLDAGQDPRSALRAVFSWSCRQLDADIARAFRLVSLHPGPDFDRYVTAALTGTTAEEADQMLARLARAYLIQPSGLSRYCMHGLLRSYAHELAAACEGHTGQHLAMSRLLDYYLHAAATTMDTLYPAERYRRPPVPPPCSPAPVLTDKAQAMSWLDTERASLVAVTAHAAGNGSPGYVTQLSAILFRHLNVAGHFHEAVTIHTHARYAAVRLGDRTAEATALSSLGAVEVRQHRIDVAARHYQNALTLYRKSGSLAGQASAQHNLGLVDLYRGRYSRAAQRLHQALTLSRAAGDHLVEAYVLSNLGTIHLQQGRYQQAATQLKQALLMCRRICDRLGMAHVLSNLGAIRLRQGRYQQAASHLGLALAISRDTGYQPGEANALTSLGVMHLRQGRYQEAVDLLQQALAVCAEADDCRHEAQALNGLGEVYLVTGQALNASVKYSSALLLTRQTGDLYEQARACSGLGDANLALGNRARAHHHWQQALILFTRLGAPEGDQVRFRLSEPEKVEIRGSGQHLRASGCGPGRRPLSRHYRPARGVQQAERP